MNVALLASRAMFRHLVVMSPGDVGSLHLIGHGCRAGALRGSVSLSELLLRSETSRDLVSLIRGAHLRLSRGNVILVIAV